jgi:hypothetical protein
VVRFLIPALIVVVPFGGKDGLQPCRPCACLSRVVGLDFASSSTTVETGEAAITFGMARSRLPRVSKRILRRLRRTVLHNTDARLALERLYAEDEWLVLGLASKQQ